MDLYFQRHDGQAVTCEDFVRAMADASGRDFGQFMRWYAQAGTPELRVERRYDPESQALTLEIAQSTPATPDQPEKLPFHLPLRVGLLGRDGTPRPLQLEGENEPKGSERVLELTQGSQRFTFVGLAEEPVPSLLRGFSAPVKLEAGLGPDELAHLMAHDTDPFVRWDAGQRLAATVLLRLVRDHAEGRAPGPLDERLVQAFGRTLDRAGEDPAFAARLLTLPGSAYLGQQMAPIEVDGIHFAVQHARAELGQRLREGWLAAYRAHLDDGPFSIETEAMARRALKNLALAYPGHARDPEAQELVRAQHAAADNMTDSMASLRLIAETAMPDRDAALAAFYERWQGEPLVINKWFSLQATIEDEAAVERVEGLLAHPAFAWSNPNRVRAVLGAFAMMNPVGFHRRDGAGYRLLAERVIELDRRNPQVAARLLGALGRWRRYDEGRQGLMRAALERVLAAPGLSRDSFEIASKSLA
jgi:aminopeptidase N